MGRISQNLIEQCKVQSTCLGNSHRNWVGPDIGFATSILPEKHALGRQFLAGGRLSSALSSELEESSQVFPIIIPSPNFFEFGRMPEDFSWADRTDSPLVLRSPSVSRGTGSSAISL
jgi:hypothetical protein